MQIQNRYQKEIDRLEKENKDLRKQLMLREMKSGNKKRRMKVRITIKISRNETNSADPDQTAPYRGSLIRVYSLSHLIIIHLLDAWPHLDDG